MRFFAIAAAGLLSLAGAPAQISEVHLRPTEPPRDEFVADTYIVHFKTRSFDTEAFRAAMLARRPAAEVEAIVRQMEQAVIRDQADFVADVAGLGGAVIAQWWIINGAAVHGGPAVAAAIERLPNVERVERDRWHWPVNGVARNTSHHKAADANLLQTSGGQFVTGTGVGVAVLDTGVDANMGGSGRPHRGYFVNGDPNNTSGSGINGSRLLVATGTSGFGAEDAHGHGTHVSGSVLNGWAASAGNGPILGMAPNANLIGVKISDNSGSAAGNWLVSGWQWVAANAATHKIRAANNSFSGAPQLTDGIQMALDSCARDADVMISVSAGNSATNTANSQNCWNGLAVGALNKFSLSVASFSARGPLDNFGRIYPDISAVGVNVESLNLDSEGTVAISSGTSMSSPMLAGAAALVRQVSNRITGLQTKALLLNNTRDIAGTRNDVGLGIVNCNRAVKQAIDEDYRTVTLTSGAPTRSITFTPDPLISPARVTIAFHHIPGPTVPNVDLFIFDASNNQVGSSTDTLISYDRVQFTFTAGQQYRAEIRGISNIGTSLDVAISGIGPEPLPNLPTLTGISPNTTTTFQPAQITLTGTELNTIDQIDYGSTTITSFIVDSATQVRFTPTSPSSIATHPVTVTNRAGTSGPQNLTITGVHPGVLETPSTVFRSVAFQQNYWSDRQWLVAVFLSTSNVPSNFPGIVNLGIGNNFAELISLNTSACGNGGRAQRSMVFPNSVPPFVTVHFQGIPYNPANPTLPLEVTNVGSSTIF
jgi:hypothetical protein